VWFCVEFVSLTFESVKILREVHGPLPSWKVWRSCFVCHTYKKVWNKCGINVVEKNEASFPY
jgi:hypothetical protein